MNPRTARCFTAKKARSAAFYRAPPVGLATFCLLALLSGCGSTSDGDSEDNIRGNILLADDNNYLSESSLDIPSIETASQTDLDICWTDVINDLQCHDLMPDVDLDNVALLRFLRLTEEQVAQRLTSGQLSQSETAGYIEYNTDHESTCTKLSDLSFFGTQVDIEEEYFESDENTYMLLFAEGTTPGVGARSMMFVRPTAQSTNTQVNATPGCGLLDFSADLSSLTSVEVPADGPWVVDWRDITRDGQGNDVDFRNIDGVLLGFYQDTTVAEIESQIFDVELIATSLWELDLTGGRTADLADATERESGDNFAGFDRDDGVWLLGLLCSTCQNPAPIVLTLLEPGE